MNRAGTMTGVTAIILLRQYGQPSSWGNPKNRGQQAVAIWRAPVLAYLVLVPALVLVPVVELPVAPERAYMNARNV